MPKYVTLVSFTDQGIQTVRDLPQRWDAARKAVEAVGGSIELYLTMGQYDQVVITEFPSDEAGVIAALAIGSGGNVRTETLKAFPEEEARKIVQGLPPA